LQESQTPRARLRARKAPIVAVAAVKHARTGMPNSPLDLVKTLAFLH